jgi:hypothetical protein
MKPGYHCEVHHATEWGDGGPTDTDADDEHRSNAAASPGTTAQDHLTSTGFTIRMNFCTPTTGMRQTG